MDPSSRPEHEVVYTVLWILGIYGCFTVLVLWRCRRRGRGQQLTIIKTAKRRRRVADPQAVGAQPYFWW